MSRALFCFLISLLAPPKRPLQFITSDVGSFSSYSCGASVEALFFSIHFLPTHLYKGKKKVICSPLPCSCPMKEAVDLERYALEGNAVWITIWHVWFLTYFFFFLHLALWFSSSHFSIPCSTEKSEATIREQHSLCSCCSMDSAADVPEVRRNLGRCGTSPWSKQASTRKEKKSSPLVQFC